MYMYMIWDNRTWRLKDTIHCTTLNVIYIVECRVHSDFMYVGSTVHSKNRWANHKSDCKNKQVHKCWVAKHTTECKHPEDREFSYLVITPIEIVKNIDRMAERELYWQANLGTLFTGGNSRRDIPKARKSRIQYSI